MFRSSLVKVNDASALHSLSLKWAEMQPWLIRTVFFDQMDENVAYVVSYSEKAQEYILTKFQQHNGATIWQKKVENGGYGTPIVFGKYVLSLTSFDSVIAYDKHSGERVFELKFGDRIRSSMNLIDGFAWLSHSSHLIAIDQYGNVAHDYYIPNSFLYGTISAIQDEIIVIGTKYVADKNKSDKFIWALNRFNGDILFEVDLGEGHIISTDTSGFWLEEGYIYTANGNRIFKVSAENGSIEWETPVFGDAHRETPIVDNQVVYYTTLKGEYGALSVNNGNEIWKNRVLEGIVSPATIVDKTLFVVSEASIYAVNKNSGEAYQKVAVGHSPYSAVTVFNNRAFIGAGEPPVNGLLLCFDISDKVDAEDELINQFYTGISLADKVAKITVETRHEWEEAYLSPSVISTKDSIRGTKIGKFTHVFSIPLKQTNIESLYVIPITLRAGKRNKTVTCTIEIRRINPLPAKVTLPIFDKPVIEENIYDSGAALTQMIEEHYGKKISQAEFRKIIDYLKTSSQWEDADFQTWRLLLKRALTSPAQSLDEFVELEKKNDGVPRKKGEH